MNIKLRATVLLAVLLCVNLIISCQITGQHIIPDMNNVALIPFENNTAEPGLEGLLMNEVVDQFIADGRLRLVEADRSDVIVRGAIDTYKKIPLIFGEQDIVEQYRMRIELSVSLIDSQTEQPLRQFSKIFRETTYSSVIPPRETEFQAQRRVLRQLSRDVLTSTVDGWPYLDD